MSLLIRSRARDISVRENSDIIANALAGNGGKINIRTTGIFGLIPTQGAVNNSLSEINASSQTGISGEKVVYLD